MSTECGFGEKSQQHASIMWMYENRYRFIHTRSVPSTHPIIFHRSCISAINAYVYIWSVNNIQNWNRCLQYNRLLCNALTATATDRPTTHAWILHDVYHNRVLGVRKYKKIIINFSLLLPFFHYVILKALTSAIISMVNSISKVIKNIFN